MNAVAYTSPFVPVEWLAAHGVRPYRMIPSQGDIAPQASREGQCPFAAALQARLAAGDAADAAIGTTTCDPMRRMTDSLASPSGKPIFLLNVPTTWQSPAAATLYRDELLRLGRFLQRLGGQAPQPSSLAEIMMQYDAARQTLLAQRPHLTGRQFVEAALRICQASPQELSFCGMGVSPMPQEAAGIPIAVVGGAMVLENLQVLDLIERFGGRVVLDATDFGERGMPPPFDRQAIREDPLAEIAKAYFGGIGDAFRRPDSLLYSFLRRQFDQRRPRGIVLVRQVWCDLWHGQARRLQQWAGLPLLDLDAGGPSGASAALTTRVQAFLEILQ